MPKDLKGIYQYEETDDEATFSELLNLGMQSVSDALAYFAGPAARREALTPAPPGAMWRDTDNGEKLWSTGPDGEWRRHQGTVSDIARAWTTSTAPVYGRVIVWDIPTVIDSSETIAIDYLPSEPTVSPYATAELATLVRAIDKTTITVRLTQFFAGSTSPCTVGWRVVKAGA